MTTIEARSSHGRRRALGVTAGVFLLAACTRSPAPAVGPPLPDRATVKFTITLVNGCPQAAVVDAQNCPPPANAPAPKDCVRVKKGHVVLFEPAAGYALRFDPFDASDVPPPSGKVITPAPGPKTSKTYTFAVVKLGGPDGSCPALDPQIIVEN